MRLILSLLALSLAAPATAQEAPLTLEQKTKLRCAVAFAMTAQLQQTGNAEAANLPDLRQSGREYFVRSLAIVMDERGWSRDQIEQAALAEANDLNETGQTLDTARSCLTLTGLSHDTPSTD